MLQTKNSVVLLFSTFCFTACDQMEQPERAPPPIASISEISSSKLSADELTARRIEDLREVNDAIMAYYADLGTFPRSDGFQSIVSHGASWIPGLAPKYIKLLPRDPLQSLNVNRPQYMYTSDGTDYKLIAHGVGATCGEFVERYGVRIDPARTQNGSCWAYGFFTSGMRDN